VWSGTTLRRAFVQLSKPSDATYSARPVGQPGCGRRLPQPGQLAIGEELLGYHNNNNNRFRNQCVTVAQLCTGHLLLLRPTYTASGTGTPPAVHTTTAPKNHESTWCYSVHIKPGLAGDMGPYLQFSNDLRHLWSLVEMIGAVTSSPWPGMRESWVE